MIGPVLHQEMLLGGRRNRLHVLRWLYAALLIIELLGLSLAYLGEEIERQQMRRATAGKSNRVSTSYPEVVGERFAVMYVRQQMIILLLITPAFVAGAITDEKRNGTLQYLMLTDLEARHIILGKLVGRVAQVTMVMLVGLPLFALFAGFGGIHPISMLFVLLVLLMPIFGLSAATLLMSAYCKQTRDAVMALYATFVAGGLVVYFVGGWLQYLDPIHVLAPAWGPVGSLDLSEAWRRLAIATAVWGGLGVVCTTVAASQLLPLYLKELQALPRVWFTTSREPVPDEPVRWREGQIEGIAPNDTLRLVPTWMAMTIIVLLSLASSLAVLWWAMDPKATIGDVLRAGMQLNVRKTADLLPGAAWGFFFQGMVVMVLGTLAVGIRCSGSIAGEREKQTWEAVLLTPMTAKQIVRGKLWGVMGSALWYLLAFAAPAISLAAFAGPLSLFFAVLWLGETVLAMYFIGAAGLWCSVRAKTPWRSLLNTMGIFYLGGLVLYMVLSPAFAILALILVLLLWMCDWLLGTNLSAIAMNNHFSRLFFIGSCIGLEIAFWLLALLFMNRTVRWIADRDRTRHWHDEPIYRRSRMNERPVRRVGY